ncbi:hypothetical protein [Pseudohoeflea coraliihabitans]|uniref:Uncharacterized protein n=1 Tax=Pseudohoeflea coraliihabitans TaxID=2860393 RepID=A0ABS6WM27_9HYPH|nr:hypothetical protein [Pseudohoeflea sp. DP4N28-3]MBW3096477.1 hypothetical protein [Pseudohoeflea sp. DP4N28-3]
MQDGDFWTTAADNFPGRHAATGIGPLKLACLFAGAAVVSALLLTPILAVDQSARIAYAPDAYDSILTGSIPARQTHSTYTIRKSILQQRPDAICIIHPGGRTSGDC